MLKTKCNRKVPSHPRSQRSEIYRIGANRPYSVNGMSQSMSVCERAIIERRLRWETASPGDYTFVYAGQRDTECHHNAARQLMQKHWEMRYRPGDGARCERVKAINYLGSMLMDDDNLTKKSTTKYRAGGRAEREHYVERM